MELDDKICLCFHVSKRKILNYIRVNKPRVASEISQCGGAGTGCGWCIPFLKKYFEQSHLNQPNEPDEISPEQYAHGRGDHIRVGKGTPPPGAIPPPAV